MIVSNILAYIDPGGGSMIIQVIVATVLGGLVAIKTFWRNIINFFKKLFFWKKQ